MIGHSKQLIRKVSILMCAVSCVLAVQNVAAEDIQFSADESTLSVEQGDESNLLRSSVSDVPSQAIPTKTKLLGYCGRALDAYGYYKLVREYDKCLNEAAADYRTCLINAGEVFRNCVTLESRKAHPNYAYCHNNRRLDNWACDTEHQQSTGICATEFYADALDTMLPSIGPIGPVTAFQICADFLRSGAVESE